MRVAHILETIRARRAVRFTTALSAAKSILVRPVQPTIVCVRAALFTTICITYVAGAIETPAADVVYTEAATLWTTLQIRVGTVRWATSAVSATMLTTIGIFIYTVCATVFVWRIAALCTSIGISVGAIRTR